MPNHVRIMRMVVAKPRYEAKDAESKKVVTNETKQTSLTKKF